MQFSTSWVQLSRMRTILPLYDSFPFRGRKLPRKKKEIKKSENWKKEESKARLAGPKPRIGNRLSLFAQGWSALVRRNSRAQISGMKKKKDKSRKTGNQITLGMFESSMAIAQREEPRETRRAWCNVISTGLSLYRETAWPAQNWFSVSL